MRWNEKNSRGIMRKPQLGWLETGGFPDILVCCVGLHHATYEELESMEFLETPVAAVACSAQLPNAQAWCTDHFNIAADDCQEIFRATDQACQELASLFGIPSPEPISDQDLLTA